MISRSPNNSTTRLVERITLLVSVPTTFGAVSLGVTVTVATALLEAPNSSFTVRLNTVVTGLSTVVAVRALSSALSARLVTFCGTHCSFCRAASAAVRLPVKAYCDGERQSGWPETRAF